MATKNLKHFFTLVLTGVLLSAMTGAPAAAKAVEQVHNSLMEMGGLKPASAYKNFYLGDSSWIGGAKEIKKSGKYYFKYLPKKHVVGISQKRNSGYKETPINGQFFANGTQAYYMVAESIYKKYVIYKYIFHTGKSHKVKTLPSPTDLDGGVCWDIGAVYKDNIFIQKENGNDGKISGVYVYDAKTKKINKIKQKWGLMGQNGKYVLTHESYASDVSTYPISLYQLGKSGMKKIKSLTKKGCGAWFCGKYIYYTDYGNSDYMEKVSLYRCGLNGKNIKRIASFSLKEGAADGSTCIVSAASTTYCYVVMPDGVYRYTYSSKKMKFFAD